MFLIGLYCPSNQSVPSLSGPAFPASNSRDDAHFKDDHPGLNFMGLLIGPRGNTLKAMEKVACRSDQNYPGFQNFGLKL